MGEFAWVTLATNDSYALGALVLGHSLRQAGARHDLVVLITPGVTSAMRRTLHDLFDLVHEVDILDSKDEANLRLLQRPELGITFTKLHCWTLTQYDKCVFLDADTMILRNVDELFEREEFSAAPDVGWPDCFNSGVFVYKPSLDTFHKLVRFALDKGSFDGGDQGLLNMFFSNWYRDSISKHLPFIYNVCATGTYSYIPAFKQYATDVKIIHFIGNSKPWLLLFNSRTQTVEPPHELKHLGDFFQHWWDIFYRHVHPTLSSDMSGLLKGLAEMQLGERNIQQDSLDDHNRRHNWELGRMDYMGADSFESIWKKICETISDPPQSQVQSAGPLQTLTTAASPEVEDEADSREKKETSEDNNKLEENAKIESNTVSVVAPTTVTKELQFPDTKDTTLLEKTTLPEVHDPTVSKSPTTPRKVAQTPEPTSDNTKPIPKSEVDSLKTTSKSPLTSQAVTQSNSEQSPKTVTPTTPTVSESLPTLQIVTETPKSSEPIKANEPDVSKTVQEPVTATQIPKPAKSIKTNEDDSLKSVSASLPTQIPKPIKTNESDSSKTVQGSVTSELKETLNTKEAASKPKEAPAVTEIKQDVETPKPDSTKTAPVPPPRKASGSANEKKKSGKGKK